MRAISIRQPWAALIVCGIKDVENRSWRTLYRGTLLIHASLGRSRRTLNDVERDYGDSITPELERLSGLVGGIVGEVNLLDCTTSSTSRWYDGSSNGEGKPNYAFVLTDARPVPFRRMPGRLSLFEVCDL